MSIYKTTKYLTFVNEDKSIVVTSNLHQEVLGRIVFADRYNSYCFLVEANNSTLEKKYSKEISEVMGELNDKLK